MNLLYCGDTHAAAGLMLSLLSLMKHVREPLHVYVLTMDMKLNDKTYQPLSGKYISMLEKVLQYENSQSTIRLFDISRHFEKECPRYNLNTRFTPCCMLRLYADEIDEIPDKILYLDADVLCRRDPMEFYNQDLSDLEMAGVLDNIGKWFFHKRPFSMDYFNSGVLLLNMKAIKEQGLFARSRRMCMTEKMFMPDQSALNKEVRKMKYWPRRFNEQGKLRKDTVFQHFTTRFSLIPYFHLVNVKPWQYERVHKELKLNEYDDLFEKAQSLTAEYERNQRDHG